MNNLINPIIDEINKLGEQFQLSQGLILTEDDLKCHVFRILYGLFNHELDSFDYGIKASPLHTELRFFDENDQLILIPDITILDPQHLSIKHSLKYRLNKKGIFYYKTSQKEFEFGGDSIIIELKFCRNKNGITNASIPSFQNDIEKLKKLQHINTKNNIIGIFVVFNKTDKKCESFIKFMADHNNNKTLFTIYNSGSVEFNK